MGIPSKDPILRTETLEQFMSLLRSTTEMKPRIICGDNLRAGFALVRWRSYHSNRTLDEVLALIGFDEKLSEVVGFEFIDI